MRKFISNFMFALPGIIAAIDRWGGRLMDLIGLPAAAQQLESWRVEYFPDIGSGTYWLIGFSVVAVILLNLFWPGGGVQKAPSFAARGKEQKIGALGSQELIAEAAANGVDSVQFKIPSPDFDEFVLSFCGVTFEQEDASLQLRFGDEAGIRCGKGDYSHVSQVAVHNESTCIVLAKSLSAGEDNSLDGSIRFLNPNAGGKQKRVQFEVIGMRGGSVYENRGSGVCKIKEGPIAIIDLSPLPGGFVSGQFSLLGVKKLDVSR